jgi:hypothetical protein
MSALLGNSSWPTRLRCLTSDVAVSPGTVTADQQAAADTALEPLSGNMLRPVQTRCLCPFRWKLVRVTPI